MNYEDFSPEAQKVIDDFRGLIENIKSGKDKAKIAWMGSWLRPCLMDCGSLPATTLENVVFAFCTVARQSEKQNLILEFIHNKRYFLPEFSSYEDYQQNKHKYPYIKE